MALHRKNIILKGKSIIEVEIWREKELQAQGTIHLSLVTWILLVNKEGKPLTITIF